MQSKTFTDITAANTFADDREAEGFGRVSIISNTPRPGTYEVRWGHETPVDNSFTAVIAGYAKIFAEREQAADYQYERDCERVGKRSAAEAEAQAAGLDGRDAEVFISGFVGTPIKAANPRAEGRLEIFKRGAAASKTPEGQRAIRAAAVAARSTMARSELAPYAEGRISNGEQ